MDGKKKKIVMIGPVYPYKGGISHYTGLLYKELMEYYDVTLISYKLQYPKFLFKKEQKDYENDSLKIEEAQYLINTANPFNWIKAAMNINKIEADMVIIQWWHPYFAPCYWTMCKVLRKTKILFICHNVFPHEHFPMDRFLTKRTLVNGDCFIVHSTKDEEDLRLIHTSPVYIKTVLPTFNFFKKGVMTVEEAREKLNLMKEEKVLLFFGFVREYKGLKYLLRALPATREQLPNMKLLVVGDFGGDKEVYIELIKELEIDSSVRIFDGYIPDHEVGIYFSACDLVVLPYESATQSGIVPIAYDFEKPVVVTDVGGLPDVVEDGKTGYVVKAEEPGAIAEAVCNYFEDNKKEKMIENIRAEAWKYSWERMRENVDSFLD